MRRTAGLLLALALTVAIAAAAIRDDPSTGPDPSLAAVTTPILTPDGPPTLQPLAEAGALSSTCRSARSESPPSSTTASATPTRSRCSRSAGS